MRRAPIGILLSLACAGAVFGDPVGPATWQPGGGSDGSGGSASVGVEPFLFTIDAGPGSANAEIDPTGGLITNLQNGPVVPVPAILGRAGGVIVKGDTAIGQRFPDGGGAGVEATESVFMFGYDDNLPSIAWYSGLADGGCWGGFYMDEDYNFNADIPARTFEWNVLHCDGTDDLTVMGLETVDDPQDMHPYGLQMNGLPIYFNDGASIYFDNGTDTTKMYLNSFAGNLKIQNQYVSGPFGPYTPTDGGPWVPGLQSPASGVTLFGQSANVPYPLGGIFGYTTGAEVGKISVGDNISDANGTQIVSGYPSWFTTADPNADQWSLTRTPGGGSASTRVLLSAGDYIGDLPPSLEEYSPELNIGSNINADFSQPNASLDSWFTTYDVLHDLFIIYRIAPGAAGGPAEMADWNSGGDLNNAGAVKPGTHIPTCSVTTEGSQAVKAGGAGTTHNCLCQDISGSYQWCSTYFSSGVLTGTCSGGSSTVCP